MTPAPRPLPPPDAPGGTDGPWAAVRQDLDHHGVALAHASLTEWRAHRPDDRRLRALLGPDWERYRAQAGHSHGEQFRVTRTLLKYVAAAALQAPPEDLELGYALSGRPCLRGVDGLDVNLSHTEDLLLVGVTTRGLIGVDTESADRPLHGSGVERHTCTPHERDLLAATPVPERNTRLVRQWTLKEAYSKALGQGLVLPFDSFGFEVTTDPPRLLRRDGTAVDAPGWTFASLRVADRYLAGVAVCDLGPAAALDPDTAEAVRRASAPPAPADPGGGPGVG